MKEIVPKIPRKNRKLADRVLSLGQNSQALLLKSRLLLAEGDSRQAIKLALKAVEMGAEEKGEEGGERAMFGGCTVNGGGYCSVGLKEREIW